MPEATLTIHRGYRYRLYPTAEQATAFAQTAGACRVLWNLALEQRQTWGRSHRLNFYSQDRELKQLREEFPWMRGVAQNCQSRTLRDLDAAFSRFFNKKAGFPRFRRKGVKDSFEYRGRSIEIEKTTNRMGRVWIPKIGWVRVRLHRELHGEICTATVIRTALGWSISIATRRQSEKPTPAPASIGIDRGVAVPIMLSDGTAYHLPCALVGAERKARQAQRNASRKRRGSMRHKKAMRRAIRAKAKVARIRNHWQHETTTDIARRFGFVALEDLRTRNMTRSAKGSVKEPGRNVSQKRGLNRSILNVGWYGLQMKLAYKLVERGGELSLVSPQNTSRMCAACGVVDAKSRESQARFNCRHCGHTDNADRNAAINILNRASRPGVEIAA